MENNSVLYPYSLEYARERQEVARWRESFRANVACAEDMRQAISKHYNNNCLDPACVQEVLDKWGFKRTNYVLANTIQFKDYDGRFHPDNKEWAQGFYVPEDKGHNCEFVCEAHPCLVDMFAKNARKAFDELGLFGAKQCLPDSLSQDFTGQVLVLKPDSLKESCWQPQNQLWLAETGFGCSPTASGRAVYATCLGDGERARWNRQSFAGILQPELLPEWAAEKLSELQAQGQKQQQKQENEQTAPAPGMEMKM